MKKLILIAALSISTAFAQLPIPLNDNLYSTDRKKLSPKQQVLLKECETAHKLGNADEFSFRTPPIIGSSDLAYALEPLIIADWEKQYGSNATVGVSIEYKNIIKNRFGEIVSTRSSYSCGWSGHDYKLHKIN